MIKQAEKSYAPLEVERQVQEFWNRAKVYAKTVAARSKGEDFYFGDGPPYTTGSIHLGQVLNKTTKDAVIRFRRMRGFRVRDQPGYDMHGLPIEVQVEKTLGITNKKEIEDLGIEYSDETDPSIYVKFPIVDRPAESLLIWTTTPWTLPANLAIAVHPQFVYAKVKVVRGGSTEFVWTMEASVPSVMALGGASAYEVVETTPGEKLVGLAFTHPLAANALFAAETLVHAYGHCWRCKTPILYRATVQWFLRVGPIKPKMIAEVQRVAWFTDWAGKARQMGWTQNLRDWCLSRQRYWGIPLPIWRCPKCMHWIVVPSSEALRKGQGYKDGMDLHRPGIDQVVLPCPKCQADMRRIPDILDVWWDSR